MAKNVLQFFQEVRFELSRVQWPSMQEFVGSTIVVLVLVCFFTVYLGIVDLGLSRLARYIFTLYGSGY